MEDSYTVHRRRKAAAKKREKTPEPAKTPQELSEDDEDETRAKMERMVEDTERMEQKAVEGQQEGLKVEPERVKKSPSRHQELPEKSVSRETKSGVDEESENRSLARESDASARSADKAKDTKNLRDEKNLDSEKPTRPRKRAKEVVDTESHGADFSDLEIEKKKVLRRRKSPEDAKRRTPSKPRYSGSDEESEPRRSSSRHKSEEKPRREKRSTSRHTYPSDSDEPEKISQRSGTKKQVIPLSDDSLIKDYAKAEKEYLRRGHSIMDPNLDDEYEITVRRRRKEKAASLEDEETAETDEPPKKSWFSWLPFFGKKKEKTDEVEKESKPQEEEKAKKVEKQESSIAEATEKVTIWHFFKALVFIIAEFKEFVRQNPYEVRLLLELRNACINGLIVGLIYCGIGALIFRFTEGAFETQYKCGVKRIKRDFLDSLWNYSHNLKEDDWKSMARRKLMEFEEQIHEAHEAGVQTYSGQRNWSFLNSFVYTITVVTTIGFGHITPSTTTGRAITIVYAIFGIPMFLIILADFGKLFTRGMKFLWAFVRRLYYTGSCRKVRRTGPVQEVMKGVQLVYDFATFRRPSQLNPEDLEEMKYGNQPQTILNLDGNMSQQPDTPGTPAMSTFDIDDEFNLPISVAIFILIGYMFIGATLFFMVEDWSFFDSFYFVFISMSTIGFGDYVPKHPVYMMCSIVYLVFGLALTSMFINVVQVMLSDQFQHASQKIGASIGVQMAEGSLQSVVPAMVEIPEVHGKSGENAEKEVPKAETDEADL